jgi:hypothetical protein
MKLNKTNIDENYLSSDVVSITLAHFLNPLHPSLKYVIQFFLIDTSRNLLQALKKLILVNHLNPFEFFVDCRKQVEVTGPNQANRVDVACDACHVLRANLLKPDLCEPSNCRDESQIVSDAVPFLEKRSLVQVE